MRGCFQQVQQVGFGLVRNDFIDAGQGPQAPEPFINRLDRGVLLRPVRYAGLQAGDEVIAVAPGVRTGRAATADKRNAAKRIAVELKAQLPAGRNGKR